MASNFGRLNFDCLAYIFSFLPIADRFNVESVCKQWHLASQQSWRDLKRLDVDIAKWKFIDEHEYKRIKMTMFKAILERSGRYLTFIDFTYSCTKADDSEIFIRNRYESAFSIYVDTNSNQEMTFHGIEALASNCTRIEKLSLCSLFINCNDQHLYELFRKNRKIRYLKLIDYAIDGSCFSGLSAENITTLLIQRCLRIISENLYILLPKCTSLSVLSLWRTRTEDRRPNRDVIKLVSSNIYIIKNLKELYLLDMNNPLYYCSLRNLRIDVSLDNLTVIQINDVVDVYIDQIIIDIGVNCKNLKMADLSGCYDVTDDILMNITSLPKLEVLCIDQLRRISDTSLVNLSEHLKALTCVGCDITDAGVVAVLNRSQNIELIDLSFCWNITSEIVNYAMDLTIGRTNNVVLNMMYDKNTHRADTIEWTIEEISPYFRLHSASKSVIQPLNVNRYPRSFACNVPYRFNSFDQKVFFQIDSTVQKCCDHV